MKKNPVFLVMLAVLLALSLVLVVGCKSDDDDDGDNNNGGGGYTGPVWPAEFVPKTTSDGEKYGGFSPDGNSSPRIDFDSEYELAGEWYAPAVAFIKTGDTAQRFQLVKIEGKKITVGQRNGPQDIVLCTDWTWDATAGTLTLTGEATNFTGLDNFKESMKTVPTAVLGVAIKPVN